ncbi:MAG: succinate dehydrogenase, hydrophobic membrane anchor protein [Pseudomonadota bacterium]
MTLRTPLRGARGLGSAGHGSSHWKVQHLTSVLLIPLMVWVMASLAMLDGPVSHVTLVFWAGKPLNAIVLITLLIVGGLHGALGMQVIIEDYVTGKTRAVLVGLVKILAFVIVVAGIFAIIRLGVFVLLIQVIGGGGA